MSQVATSAVFEKVKEWCLEFGECTAAQVTPEATFIPDLGFDSLAVVEMLMQVEEEYGFEIPDDEAEELRTVGDAVAYIERRLAEKG